MIKAKFILIALLLAWPLAAQAAHQVPGEVPKVQPLQPIDEGSRPNYSQNVESSNQPAADRAAEPAAAATPAPQAGITAPAQPVHSYRWVWFAVIVLAVAGGAVWLIRKNKKPPVAMLMALPIATMLLAGFLYRVAPAQAQSVPEDGRTIQRTIDVIDDPSTAKQAPDTSAQSQAKNSVFYGLGAIVLILIVLGAAALLIQSDKKPPGAHRKSM